MKAHLLIALVDEQLHHIQLIGGQQRHAPRQREGGAVQFGGGNGFGGQPPLYRLAPGQRAAGEQQALGPLQSQAIDPQPRIRPLISRLDRSLPSGWQSDQSM